MRSEPKRLAGSSTYSALALALPRVYARLVPIQNWSQIIVMQLSEAQRKLGIVPGGGVPATRRIDTTAPLMGGGDFSMDRTHFMPKASAAQDGYLSAADFASFSGGGLTNLDGGTAASVYGGVTAINGGNA